MPRKLASFRIDERVLEVIATLAVRSGVEPQRFIENYFFARGKELGLIPPEAQPLGETRGGKRPGAGKPKKTESESAIQENADRASGSDSEGLTDD
ncbi:MAG: hypothetical protein KME18_26580 [Phormidium tanganyikae FI6-MK23]|jgi:hypothetical protein|nr:hypothetical protein [Phormidium tanganyikae FI6-MK23]